MKSISDIFYSALCGICTWMAIHQFFVVCCLICSDNQNDVLLPVVPLAIYMLILVFAKTIATKLYGKQPKLCIPIFCSTFILCLTTGIVGNKTEALITIAVSKQLGINVLNIIIGIIFYLIICAIIIIFCIKKSKNNQNN